MMPAGGKGKPLGAALILASKGPPKEAEDEDDVGLESAAEEILNAVKSDDPKALAAALRSAVAMCRD